MRIETSFEFNTAAHQSYMVESPFKQRGGIMYIANPENLKTAIVKTSLSNMPKALCFGDLTLKQLVVIRDNIADEKFVTLGFTELEKLYERQASVADNVEGVLKAMTEEGFSHAAFEDKRIWVPNARCLVIAAVLRSLYQMRFQKWELGGFTRRFIQIKYRLDPASREKILQAIRDDRLIEFPALYGIYPSTHMPMNVTKEETANIESLGPQMQSTTPLLLMKKVLTVLKWRHSKLQRRKGHVKAMEIVMDMQDVLQQEGGEITI